MKETIKELNKEKEVLKERLKNIDNAIKAFQKICTHQMEYEGHDSHKDHYICSICGYWDSI